MFDRRFNNLGAGESSSQASQQSHANSVALPEIVILSR